MKDLNITITPAIKHLKYCHSGESRNPGGYWMRDQVRHEGISVFNRRVNNMKNHLYRVGT